MAGKPNIKNGYYVELTNLFHTGRQTKLFIPSDDNKQEWFSFHSLLADYKVGSSPLHNKNHICKDAAQTEQLVLINHAPTTEIYILVPSIY